MFTFDLFKIKMQRNSFKIYSTNRKILHTLYINRQYEVFPYFVIPVLVANEAARKSCVPLKSVFRIVILFGHLPDKNISMLRVHIFIISLNIFMLVRL